jgi:Flp pilus assembly protein TadB
VGLTDRLAGLYPLPVEPGPEFQRAVRFLGLDSPPSTVLAAGYVLSALGAVALAGLSLLLPPALRPAGLLVALACGLAGSYVAGWFPRLLATARRTRSLGAAPDLVARAALRMRVTPAPERAAAFAADTGRSRLAASLGRHVRAARSTGDTGLEAFAAEWAEWFPSLGRALALVEAAGAVPADRRGDVLDRALDAVLDGVRTRTQEYATSITGPATALYAFGVLLPTALVALLPAARTAGLAVTPVSVALVYDLIVPLVVVTAGAYLLARRPVAFPPPGVVPSHPAVGRTVGTRTVLLSGVAGAPLGWLVASRVAPGWAPPLVALGWGVGGTLWLYCRSVRDVHERVRAAERELPDALALLGRRVAAGESVERAVDAASEEITGPLGEALAAGTRRQRRLQVGIERAVLGDGGVLERLPSRRLRGTLSVVALAGREGHPVGGALLSLADHVGRLQRVEADARAELESVCNTLQSTGSVFGPLVAGSTVALAAGMTGSSFVGGSGMPWLGGVVGVYVLILAVLLPGLAVGLRRGFDPALVGHAVGKALCVAATVYLASYVLVGGIA